MRTTEPSKEHETIRAQCGARGLKIDDIAGKTAKELREMGFKIDVIRSLRASDGTEVGICPFVVRIPDDNVLLEDETSPTGARWRDSVPIDLVHLDPNYGMAH